MAATKGRTAWQDVPANLVERQKLTTDQIRELARIGRGVEQHYGHHQDIEWAFEGGKFYLTQARPVTTMRAADESTTTKAMRNRRRCSSPASRPARASASGAVRIVHDPHDIDIVKQGDVLVAEMTTPDFVPAMKRAAAIVTERGGPHLPRRDRQPRTGHPLRCRCGTARRRASRSAARSRSMARRGTCTTAGRRPGSPGSNGRRSATHAPPA